MITERNMIFANPQAYRVFPQIGKPYNTGITDTAIYEGYLQVTDGSGTTKSFTNTSTIDFTGFKGVIDIDQYTNTGSVKLGRWRITDTIENDVMSSMVLWYDLAKQGATNESMAADPRLIDHSGNGHHATCYNFAWNLKSGISSTTLGASAFSTQFGSIIEGDTIKINNYICANNGWLNFIYLRIEQGVIYNFIVKGIISTNRRFNVYFDGKNHFYNSGDTAVISYIGGEDKNLYIQVECLKADVVNAEFTFEQGYPNALVSDGVDDYAVVEGLPILTKERGYTVVAKRKWIDSSSGEPKMLLSDGNDYGHESLMVENKQAGSDGFSALSFGSRTNVALSESDIIYQTSTSYCGNSLSSGQEETESLFSIFSNFGLYDFSKIALYSLLLFNRDLTAEEIEWVKTNLITE